MAETPSPPAKIETHSKTVQELSTSGEDLPENYVHKGTDVGVLDASVPIIDIPIIDIALLTSNTDELDKLHSALSFRGCFQAINHGMTTEFLDEMREFTQQFFALPPEQKQKYSREEGSFEGYGNDMKISDQQILDWNDRLYLTTYPVHLRHLKVWPESPESFREMLDEFTLKSKLMIEVILKAMARSLKLEDNCFLDMYGEEPLMAARFSLYPPCPKSNQVLGVKPHADASAISILLPDKEVEGLQFLKDDQWYRVPIIPEALIIILGDQTEIMSNGMFKSPLHRVVTNPERERISIGLFSSPNPEKEIEPLDELVNETRPRLYKKMKNYPSILFEYFQLGRRPIEAAII